MQTRRDQLQAYRFQNRRALAALVTGEPNALEPPMRRLTVITLSGIMIAILIAAGYALLGVFKPVSGDAWKQPGAIIDVRNTGARFVLYPHDVLHPVLNYTSAALVVGVAQGAPTPKLVFVDPGDIDSASRGATIGIPGLPDSLPSAGGLRTWPLTVCSRLQSSGSPDHLDAHVGVYVGSTPRASAVAAQEGVIVQTAQSGARYLLADGHRYAMSSQPVETALNLQAQPTLKVGTAFLDSLPQGPALAPLSLPDLGQPSAAVTLTPGSAGLPVGLLVQIKETMRYDLVLPDGLQPLTDVQVALARPLAQQSSALATPMELSENQIVDIPPSKLWTSEIAPHLQGLPTHVPGIATTAATNGGVCTIFRSTSSPAQLLVPGSLEPSYVPPAVQESAASLSGVADSVTVASGGAALIRSASGTHTTEYLVAAPGQKFPVTASSTVPAGTVLKSLGYGSVAPTVVPEQLISLLRTGPALDPQAARRTVS